METSRKILIIDDEKDFGKMTKLSLEKSDRYEVDLSHDGIDGLEKIKQKKYDLVILDILMPKMEGHEVLWHIKAISDTPVIILSAYVPPPMKKEILARGASACLSKPIELEQLSAAIRAFSAAA